MQTCHYCFELAGDLSELNTLCWHLDECGNKLELPQRCRIELNLSLDELFTNIISYGFEDASEHQIRFSLSKVGDTLVVEVEDDGMPFNPLDAAAPEADRDLEAINVGGLGIHLMKKMVDDIDYQRVAGKNKLTLRKCVAAA